MTFVLALWLLIPVIEAATPQASLPFADAKWRGLRFAAFRIIFP